MSSNPAPGYVPGGDDTGNRVYYPRPDERIHACCLYVFKPTGARRPPCPLLRVLFER